MEEGRGRSLAHSLTKTCHWPRMSIMLMQNQREDEKQIFIHRVVFRQLSAFVSFSLLVLTRFQGCSLRKRFCKTVWRQPQVMFENTLACVYMGRKKKTRSTQTA